MKAATVSLILAAATANATDYRVRWQPVPEATTYSLHDGANGAGLGTMPVCGQCEPDAPLPCCRAVVSASPITSAYATALNANGESAPSNTVQVAQMPTTTQSPSPSTTSSTVAPVPSTTSTTVPVGSGLVLAYGAEELSGTLTDSAGTHTGTLGTGTTRIAAGRYGRGLRFAGGNGVSTPNAADLAIARPTMVAWVKPTAAGTGWRMIMGKTSAGSPVAYFLALNQYRPAFGFYLNGWRELEASATVQVDVWSCVAATYDGSTARVYINGMQVGSAALTGPLPQNTTAFTLGTGFSNERFQGDMDEFRLYNRALSAAEVTSACGTGIVAPAPSTTTTSSSTTSTIMCPSVVPCP